MTGLCSVRFFLASYIGQGSIMGWGTKAIEIRSVESGQLDGVFMHKREQKLRFLCERNDKVRDLLSHCTSCVLSLSSSSTMKVHHFNFRLPVRILFHLGKGQCNVIVPHIKSAKEHTFLKNHFVHA